MVNFMGIDSIPPAFRDRLLYRHSPEVTLMRTTSDECARLGCIIAEKLNAAQGPVALYLPLRGVSAIDREGQPFWDPVADRTLFDALRSSVSSRVECVALDLHINDPAFADAMATRLAEWVVPAS